MTVALFVTAYHPSVTWAGARRGFGGFRQGETLACAVQRDPNMKTNTNKPRRNNRFHVLVEIDGVGSSWVPVVAMSAKRAEDAAVRAWGGRALMVQPSKDRP